MSENNDRIFIKYIPLSRVKIWERNPKRHDIGSIVESIRRYGFLDPAKYDSGLDAIVYGNGRIQALQMMKNQGESPPRGIAVDENGEWLVPVKFGLDLPSREVAEAFAVDHNNITLTGGDFSALEIASMWDETYIELLDQMAQSNSFPVTVNGEDIDMMLEVLQYNSDIYDLEKQYDQTNESDFWPVIRLQVPPDTYDIYIELMDQMEGETEVEKFTNLLEYARNL